MRTPLPILILLLGPLVSGLFGPTNALALLDVVPSGPSKSEQLQGLATALDGRTFEGCRIRTAFNEQAKKIDARLEAPSGVAAFLMDVPTKQISQLGWILTNTYRATSGDRRYDTTLTYLFAGRRQLRHRIDENIWNLVGAEVRTFEKANRRFGWPDSWKNEPVQTQACQPRWLPFTRVEFLARTLNSNRIGSCDFFVKSSQHGQRHALSGILRGLEDHSDHPIEIALDSGSNRDLSRQQILVGSDSTLVRYVTDVSKQGTRHVLEVSVDSLTGDIDGLEYRRFKQGKKWDHWYSVMNSQEKPVEEIVCMAVEGGS